MCTMRNVSIIYPSPQRLIISLTFILAKKQIKASLELKETRLLQPNSIRTHLHQKISGTVVTL